jgi:hypothetical protein
VEKIRVIHDTVGKTLTVWIDDPKKETVCEETADEVIVMKDRKGRIIGFELLHYKPAHPGEGIAVETLIRSQP